MTSDKILQKALQEVWDNEAAVARVAGALREPGNTPIMRKQLSARYVQAMAALTGARLRLERLQMPPIQGGA